MRNIFRANRGARLANMIKAAAVKLGRPLRIVDVGGSTAFWHYVSVGTADISTITIFNISAEKITADAVHDIPVTYQQVDARDAAGFADNAFDVLVCNSVIEHVGGWRDIEKAVGEMRRLAPIGWVQTPAFAFPFEPHYLLPMVHWFPLPIKAWLIRTLPRTRYQEIRNRGDARAAAESINLLTFGEMRFLFPDCKVDTERFLLLPKSYIAVWAK
jgi:ubiquinone/menaquinone biosynthesis C-methylase UbiE